MRKYDKAYKEIIEILKYMSQEDRGKIPNKMIRMFEEKMDPNHEFKYDNSKNFDEQELLIETKAILANIFRDYWATPEQREKIVEKQDFDRLKVEEQKKQQYNTDNLFKKKHKVEEIVNKTKCKELVKYKEESFLRKILRKIKSILKK